MHAPTSCWYGGPETAPPVPQTYVSPAPGSTFPSAPSLSLRVAVYDVLLALHLLSAAIAFVTVVMFSAWAVGAPITRGATSSSPTRPGT